MALLVELETDNEYDYNFFPNLSDTVRFNVRAPKDVNVALLGAVAEVVQIYEIFIGGWENSKSAIRKNVMNPLVIETPTLGILDDHEYRGFWVRWYNGTITVGIQFEASPFLSCIYNGEFNVEYVGFRTASGAYGCWRIELPKAKAGVQHPDAGPTSSFCWVAARKGQVPPNAFAGGEVNGEPVYVVRAKYRGGLHPGKLIPSQGRCYVPWGGGGYPVKRYEVLCDFTGQWLASSGPNVPTNAVRAGYSEYGEPLYIGRVHHDGTLTVGKVQPSHGRCFIAYGEDELPFSNYEVLVQ